MGRELGQHRIISTARSTLKSMAEKLPVTAARAAVSPSAECVLGNNPLLTSSTCHRGNAPFATIYTEAELSGKCSSVYVKLALLLHCVNAITGGFSCVYVISCKYIMSQTEAHVIASQRGCHAVRVNA